jgi:hypothetical protein
MAKSVTCSYTTAHELRPGVVGGSMRENEVLPRGPDRHVRLWVFLMSQKPAFLEGGLMPMKKSVLTL